MISRRGFLGLAATLPVASAAAFLVAQQHQDNMIVTVNLSGSVVNLRALQDRLHSGMGGGGGYLEVGGVGGYGGPNGFAGSGGYTGTGRR